MKNKKIWTRAAAFVLAAMLIMSESTIVTLAEDTISATSYSVEETNEEAVLEQNTSEDTQVYDTTEDLTIVEVCK